MNVERIKEIQLATAYPDSHSVYIALMQVWTECAREKDRETTVLHAELEHTQIVLKRAQQDAISALDLVSRIREALGDNGKRMQDELIEYCKKLAHNQSVLESLANGPKT